MPKLVHADVAAANVVNVTERHCRIGRVFSKSLIPQRFPLNMRERLKITDPREFQREYMQQPILPDVPRLEDRKHTYVADKTARYECCWRCGKPEDHPNH